MCWGNMSCVAENEYDLAGDEEWLEVEVVDPLFDMMGIEVFFKCFYKTPFSSLYLKLLGKVPCW